MLHDTKWIPENVCVGGFPRLFFNVSLLFLFHGDFVFFQHLGKYFPTEDFVFLRKICSFLFFRLFSSSSIAVLLLRRNSNGPEEPDNEIFSSACEVDIRSPEDLWTLPLSFVLF